ILKDFFPVNAIMVDYNNDDYLDINFVGFADSYIYKNNQDSTFIDANNETGIFNIGTYGHKAVFLDIDNDGDKDLFYGIDNYTNKLFENNGDGTFTDISASSGISITKSTDAISIDYNNDGFIDIVACGSNQYEGEFYVLKNNGDYTFTKMLGNTGLPAGFALHTGQMVSFDYDNDNDQDILISNYDYLNPILLYQNNGDGTFSNIISSSGIDTSGGGAMSVAAGDYNNDGYIDIYFSGFSDYIPIEIYSRLYRNNGDGTFSDVTEAAGSPGKAHMGYSYGTDFADYDNDGDLDLYLSGSGVSEIEEKDISSALYRNNSDGTFTYVTHIALPDESTTKWALGTIGDYDNDGSLDIYAPASSIYGGKGLLLKNIIGTESNWIKIKLDGTESNRDGLGARVHVRTGGLTQIREVHNSAVAIQPLHFGLGAVSLIDEIKVYWPSGNIQKLFNISANQVLTIQEAPTGAAILLSPSGTIDIKTPTYIWSEIEEAVQYRLIVDDSIGNKIDQWYTASDIEGFGTGTCSITPATELFKGQATWWIETMNGIGGTVLSNGMPFYVNVNALPLLDSIGDKSIDENALLEFQVTAADPDGDEISYSADELPEGAAFTDQAFSWAPTFDQSGMYSVIFNASDGEDITSETINITVINVNRPPVLEAIGNRSVAEGNLLEFDITADDPDGDTIVYSVSNLPEGADFNGQRFNWTPTFEQSGVYTVTFTASDGEDADSETITITVTGMNRPPILDPIGDKSVDENSLLRFVLSAVDPDGGSITYSMQNAPSGAALSGATFNWTPTYEQEGIYNITFSASDGQDSASEIVTVTVNNVNRPPVIDFIGNKAVGINKTLAFAVTGYDPDGDVIAYNALSLPPGAAFDNGAFSWVPVYAQIGTHSLSFSISDESLSDSEAITITVREINNPPVFGSVAPRSIYAEESLVFNVAAIDPDGDFVKYSVDNLPEGAVFADQTFSWIPALSQTGSYSVLFSGTDGELTDSVTVSITVASATPDEPPPDDDPDAYPNNAESADSKGASTGYFVPMYTGEDDDEDSDSAKDNSASSEKPKTVSSEASPETISAESLTNYVLDEYQALEGQNDTGHDANEQINFLRQVGFNDENIIKGIKEGTINFSYFIYSTKDNSHYLGKSTFSSYDDIVKTMAREGRVPADFYYADSSIKNGIFDAYTKYVNETSMYKPWKTPKEMLEEKDIYKAIDKLKAFSTKGHERASLPIGSALERSPINGSFKSTEVADKAYGAAQTLFSRVMEWLRKAAEIVKSRAANFLKR
ncbi:MAG: putative Ig domain-containing protein, partial [Candidatus Omnitrophota bacterium]